MWSSSSGSSRRDYQVAGRERINQYLAREGLSYAMGGKIVPRGHSAATAHLMELLAENDPTVVVEDEFKRCVDNLESDPPAALTAACSILESLFKQYLEDEGIALPKVPTLKPLWTLVQASLGLRPGDMVDDDLKKILQGLATAVDGIGALRTHAGSAHGRGKVRYQVTTRHARLAINTAHTLASFILETWKVRKESRSQPVT
jgi:hypothetical protein